MPGGGEAELSYTFDKMINFGYSEHDITEVYAPTSAEGGKTGTFMAHSVLYINELMTFGLSFSQAGKYYRFGFINDGSADGTKCFYGFTIQQQGLGNLTRGMDVSQSFSGFPEMPVGETSYFAIGVFDTFNLDGSAAGETVYMRRTDIKDGKPDVVFTFSKFFTSAECADRPDALPDAKNHTVLNTLTDNAGTVPKDSFYAWAVSDSGAALKSGLVPSVSGGAESPSKTYFDNTTGQIRWNRVENATGYEWSYAGKNDWESTTDEYIPAERVEAAIATAKADGAKSVRFAIRAVNADGKSQTVYCPIDLTAFYTVRSTIKDISQVKTTLDDPAVTLTSRYSYEQAYGLYTFCEFAFTFESTPANYAVDHRILLAMNAAGFNKYNGYVLSIFASGDIAIIKNSTQNWSKGQFWRRSNAVAFEAGVKYSATCGVEELYDLDGNKVADRVSVKIREQQADGYWKVLTIISYDNYEYDVEGVSVPNYPAYSKWGNLQIAPASDKTWCLVSCVNSTREYQVTPVINGKAITDKMQTVR